MRNILLIGAVAAATFATAAQAQDTTDRAPFSGIYVGASGGYDVQPNDVGSSILFDRGSNGSFGDTVSTAAGANAFSPGFCNGRAVGATPLPGSCRNDKDGWSYYGRVGFDTQRGNIVVGALGEFGKTEITDSVSAFSTTPANYVMTRDVKWEASIRARAGYAAGTTLFYGTFGPGYANIDRSFTSTNTANSFAQFGKRKQFGIVGGGGVEQKLGENFSIGMEYTYHQYQDDDARVRVSQGTAAANNPFILPAGGATTDFRRSDDKFRWHSLRATAAFRF
ncbi:outer membrane beta-barrel protein [Sphingomonadaceae bacterium OTU29LAMAA1]|uniref:outer membrane protein n=1 Tax=Sphingomonas sp. Leaf37 TaxID=2876552 RepID=UPI001E4EC1F9|nr:outer membrane beta-barrel protein [Sphingomonas sp. Leaf37]USU04635.1 outer membrane beta-barrel protein [Sphingomonadaceae bacterium OTU29LAMAA1]